MEVQVSNRGAQQNISLALMFLICFFKIYVLSVNQWGWDGQQEDNLRELESFGWFCILTGFDSPLTVKKQLPLKLNLDQNQSKWTLGCTLLSFLQPRCCRKLKPQKLLQTNKKPQTFRKILVFPICQSSCFPNRARTICWQVPRRSSWKEKERCKREDSCTSTVLKTVDPVWSQKGIKEGKHYNHLKLQPYTASVLSVLATWKWRW